MSEALADEAVRSNELVYRVGANEISSYAPPSQFVWPHLQTISVLSAMPSQWALQYFALSGGMQLHAAFAHFLGVLAMMPPWMCPLDGKYDAGIGTKDSERFLAEFCLISVEFRSNLRYSLKTRRASAIGGQQCCSHTPYEFAAEHCLGFSLLCRRLAALPRTNSAPG